VQLVHDLVEKEWSHIVADPESYGRWLFVYRAQRMADQVSPLPIANSLGSSADAEGDGTFIGTWGSSKSKDHVIDPELIKSRMADVSKRRGVQPPTETPTAACEDESLYDVKAPLPPRNFKLLFNWGSHCMGCCYKKRTVCREHLLTRSESNRLDQATTYLSKWTDSLGKELAESCSVLACIRFFRNNELVPNEDLIVLLGDVRWSPKVQYFCPCELIERSGTSRYTLPNFPFAVSLTIEPSRLSSRKLSLLVQTSDHIGFHSLAMFDSLKIYTLHYTIDCDADALLLMEVTGMDAAFEVPRPKKAPKRKQPDSSVDLFDFENPFAMGRAQAGDAGETTVAASFCSEGNGDSVSGDAFAEEADDEMAEALDDMPPDVAADIRERLREELSFPQSCLSTDPIDLQSGANSDQEAIDDLEADESELAHTLEEFVSDAVVGGDGHVTSTLEPFRSQKQARITEWPFDAPDHQRSVSCRCGLHKNCSAAVARRKVSDEYLLSWFFQGEVVPPGSSTEVHKAATAAHKALWITMRP
jgi:hypothetical protein